MVRYGFSGGALALLVGLAFAACGSDDGGGKSSSGGSGGSAGDAGGAGGDSGDAGDSGPSLAAICVKSPVAAAPAGDATCPANKPGVADALDEALTKAGIDRCKYGFSDATMAIWKPIFGAIAAGRSKSEASCCFH